mmetsp:Transcript_39990/g.84004  ORF Transcript_39990/g.84004 Transcript_39990/m.84004 type:complete len:99 (-) Transcript_39990:1108-1404(-)
MINLLIGFFTDMWASQSRIYNTNILLTTTLTTQSPIKISLHSNGTTKPKKTICFNNFALLEDNANIIKNATILNKVIRMNGTFDCPLHSNTTKTHYPR